MRHHILTLTLVMAWCAGCVQCGVDPPVQPGMSSSSSGGGGGSSSSGAMSSSSNGRPPVIVGLDWLGTGSAMSTMPATLTGRIWAPGNAPGMVPAGQEIPVGGAVIGLTDEQPPPVPQEVHCERCLNLPMAGITTSDPQGRFTLENIPEGTWWVVIQKAQFRKEWQVTFQAGEMRVLTTDEGTLPSRTNPAAGTWIPRVALAVGVYDQLEDILGKMHLGSVDSSGVLERSSARGIMDLYSNSSFESDVVGDIEDLAENLDLLRSYHIIFVPCDSGDGAVMRSANARANLAEYVRLGGKLYVTDWSAEWMDTIWPAYVRFDADHDTAPGGSLSDGDGTPGYDALHARAAHQSLRTWLDGQMGPLLPSHQVGSINANDFEVEGNWNHIVDLPSVMAPVGSSQRALTWVEGDWEGAGLHPLTVTFEPQGCGRVLYSTYHTTESAHLGLVPQERILLYMILEIGTCRLLR